MTATLCQVLPGRLSGCRLSGTTSMYWTSTPAGTLLSLPNIKNLCSACHARVADTDLLGSKSSCMVGATQDTILVLDCQGANSPAPAASFPSLTLRLQEAASANSLSDVRFKLLNVALLTAGLGHILILGPRFNGGGPLLPLVRYVFGVFGHPGRRNISEMFSSCAQALVGVIQHRLAFCDLSVFLCRCWAPGRPLPCWVA